MVDLQVGPVVPCEGGPDHWDSAAAVGVSVEARRLLDRSELGHDELSPGVYPLLAKLLQYAIM